MWALEEDTTLADRVALVCATAAAVSGATSGLALGGASLLGLLLGPALGAALGEGWKQRLALGLLGATSWAPLLLWGRDLPFSQAVAGAAMGVTLILAERWRRRRRGTERAHPTAEAATVGLVSATVLLAFSQVSGASAPPAEGVTASVLRAVAGGGAGLLVALALVPLHLRSLRDRVAAALRKLRPLHDGAIRAQLREIVQARHRVLRLLTRASVDCATRDETRRGLDALALTAIELAERFDPVHEVLERFGPEWMSRRAEQLRAQHAGVRDPDARRQLERSLAALEDQQAQLSALLEGRQRLLARLGRELASLERAETSLAMFASGNASLSGLRLEWVGEDFTRQAEELADEAQALQTALAEASVRGST
jgi:hypothetical protein